MIQPNFLKRTSCVLAGLLCFDGASLLQAGKPIEQARNVENSRSPEHGRDGRGFSLMTGDVVPSSPGDRDLGEQWLLKPEEKERPLILVGDIAGYATNNVALTENGTHKDQFIVGQIAASYQPKIAENLLAEITFRQAFIRYHQFTELNFDSQDMGAGLTCLDAVCTADAPGWVRACRARCSLANDSALSKRESRYEWNPSQVLASTHAGLACVAEQVGEARLNEE